MCIFFIFHEIAAIAKEKKLHLNKLYSIPKLRHRVCTLKTLYYTAHECESIHFLSYESNSEAIHYYWIRQDISYEIGIDIFMASTVIYSSRAQLNVLRLSVLCSLKREAILLLFSNFSYNTVKYSASVKIWFYTSQSTYHFISLSFQVTINLLPAYSLC